MRPPGVVFVDKTASGARMMQGQGPPRFLADQMFGRVARLLRFLGYDCELVAAGKSDGALVARAAETGRILLTAARSIGELHSDLVLLFHLEAPEDAVRDIVRRWPLPFHQTILSRCSRCNIPVEDVGWGSVRELLPPTVRERPQPVRRCPACERLYWVGGHIERLLERLNAQLGLDLRPPTS
jgi:uncharacterized protein